MSTLAQILDHYRAVAVTEREKGTYFEELMLCYLRNEASYKDLYQQVWSYAEWAAAWGLDRRDTGIDLVAQTRGSEEFHAIQCKLYAEDYQLQKADIDSFFTASGQKPFTHRLIVSTTNHWSEHAAAALRNQQPPVSKLDLYALQTSQIDWSRYQPRTAPVLKPKKQPRPHQLSAINAVQRGLATTERGKLIMACGTGKTFTSLKIAEAVAGAGGRVLFLVPSLALLSQTLTEWTQDSTIPLHSFAVCSDSDVGKKRKPDDDAVQTFTHELRYPATTNAARLATEMALRHDVEHLSVVFSTYHSIAVIHAAQHQHALPDFNLIICDEAHRTTGATFDNQEESAFVRVHDAEFIRAAKRLYMTATPRIYGTSAKISAEVERVALCSMDDETLYGPELYVITFSEAVKQRLLVDYKVIVLAVEEAHVSRRLQQLLTDTNKQLNMDDAAKIVGCWKALSKYGLSEQLSGDAAPMRRAVAFCQVIEIATGAKTHKVSSKQIAGMFQAVVAAYQQSEETPPPGPLPLAGEGEKNPTPSLPVAGEGEKNCFPPGREGVRGVLCEAAHVDGTMNASEKAAKLEWLKAEPLEQTCRILSNVRCLSEGVDVPALDAVLFLTPRNSQVDVVQSVGRVMRLAPGKQRGYVILPVVIPLGLEPHAALNDNKTYAVVWQVLQALRSHDDRFDAMVNKLELIGQDRSKMEVIAITDKLVKPQSGAKTAKKTAKQPSGRNDFSIGTASVAPDGSVAPQAALQFEIGEIERAIYAKLVQKVGNRHHWEDWANDIAKIAQTHMERLAGILHNPNAIQEQAAFADFASELRANLNPGITDAEVVEMLAQHLLTQPVFAALFAGQDFTRHNPISQALQRVVEALHEHNLLADTATLQGFYASVQLRAAGIDNAAGRQRIILELYDKFFRNAFPRLTDRLGIVYTPVEVVDFILHSVNHLLQQEFGQTLGSPGVQILDPFTGAGAFVTRLLQSGLITTAQLPYKYQHDIHANEIVLLAYYIAAINIEAVYHSLKTPPPGQGGGVFDYQPFPGICLTDTFQLYEQADLLGELLRDNSTRRSTQKGLDIQVIIGNPPYSAGQGSANDNNQNLAYPGLDARIRSTYAERSTATNKNALYDSYIRAIRWASDRIGNSGIIGFVTNAGFLDSNAADGLRQCLAEEFSSIYILHLRGNQRTSGELSRKEGGKIFGSGSRAPIAISLLVKGLIKDSRLSQGDDDSVAGPGMPQARIYFHDIGDYLTREDKLAKIHQFGSIAGISTANAWQVITTDQHGDWLRQRDDNFSAFIAMGDKKGTGIKLFDNFSLGVGTSRDAWCYNASKQAVAINMGRMIEFYNAEVARFAKAFTGVDKKARTDQVNNFIDTDSTKISWSSSLVPDLVRLKPGIFDKNKIMSSMYRPFQKQWLYYDGMFNHRVGQMPRIFPDAEAENLVIVIKGNWAGDGQLVLMTDRVVADQPDGGGQCFPLYLYDTPEAPTTASIPQEGLFGDPKPQTPTRTRRTAITAAGLAHFHRHYPGETINPEDIFYYIYGLLHSPIYRERYADNLSKQLPRIPCVDSAAAFWQFSHAGRELAALHVNYDQVALYPLTIDNHGHALSAADYRVEKLRYGKRGKDKDLTTIIYNAKITLTDIPILAYAYVVNGKAAIDWVVERQGLRVDKASGIGNDANAWAVETMHKPRYPLELLQRVITVSMETLRIVATLPEV